MGGDWRAMLEVELRYLRSNPSVTNSAIRCSISQNFAEWRDKELEASLYADWTTANYQKPRSYKGRSN